MYVSGFPTAREGSGAPLDAIPESRLCDTFARHILKHTIANRDYPPSPHIFRGLRGLAYVQVGRTVHPFRRGIMRQMNTHSPPAQAPIGATRSDARDLVLLVHGVGPFDGEQTKRDVATLMASYDITPDDIVAFDWYARVEHMKSALGFRYIARVIAALQVAALNRAISRGEIVLVQAFATVVMLYPSLILCLSLWKIPTSTAIVVLIALWVTVGAVRRVKRRRVLLRSICMLTITVAMHTLFWLSSWPGLIVLAAPAVVLIALSKLAPWSFAFLVAIKIVGLLYRGLYELKPPGGTDMSPTVIDENGWISPSMQHSWIDRTVFAGRSVRTALDIAADVVLYVGDVLRRSYLVESLRATVSEALEQRPVGKLYVVAHSLGSVVAIDYLLGRQSLESVEEVVLVTLGSPYSRFFVPIFGHEFVRAGSVYESCVRKFRRFRWLNVYRRGDPVGEALFSDQARGLDIPVGQRPRFGFAMAAHMNYWADDAVLAAAIAGIKEIAEPIDRSQQSAPENTQWRSTRDNASFVRRTRALVRCDLKLQFLRLIAICAALIAFTAFYIEQWRRVLRLGSDAAWPLVVPIVVAVPFYLFVVTLAGLQQAIDSDGQGRFVRHVIRSVSPRRRARKLRAATIRMEVVLASLGDGFRSLLSEEEFREYQDTGVVSFDAMLRFLQQTSRKAADPTKGGRPTLV